MANRFPLIVNTTSGNSVQELPSGDFLDLSSSGIANSGNITVSGVITATGNIAGSYFIGNGSALTGIASGTPTKIANGTSEANIGASGGNANITIGGTSNVVVVATTGVVVTGITSASGNITGGNILTGGLISAASTVTGTSFLGAVVSVTANVTGGNLTTAGILTVNSGAAATAIVNGASNAVGNIGSSTTYFNRLFAQATTALYADLAEVYKADAQYPPGTVLIFGGTQEVTMSTESHDTNIAGVVSTHPAHVMNSGLESEFTVEVGLIGRVPCRVIGPITAGDRVVSSNRAGVAKRLDMSKYQPGVIIGKAVESYSGTNIGTIEVVVGRL
jgi:hypothetical protein